MDDNELGDQGKKTNASQVHKPSHARQYDMAPVGSVGRRAGGLPGVTGKGSEELHQADRKIDFRKNQDQAPAKDNRPIAVKTDVEAIDKQSEERGQQLKTEDEIKELAGKMAAEKEAAAKPQERHAPDANNVTYAPITGIDALDQQSKGNGDTLISQEELDQKRADAVQPQPDNAQQQQEGPRVSQSDFAKAFRESAKQTQTIQQSKGIDPNP